MATEILTIVRDDLDGTEGAETVEFAIDGTFFTIDLSDKNQERLRKCLAPFIEKAKAQPWPERRGRGVKRATKTTLEPDPSVYRAWWSVAENRTKYSLPEYNDRGRIPGAVVQAYN